MIKCIIFDAYGTLISTGSGSVDAVRKILKDKNINISPEEFYSKWKVLHRKHIDEITLFVNEKSIFEKDLKVLYDFYSIDGDYRKDVRYMLDSLENRQAYPETVDVLNVLSKAFYLCIGSTTDSKPLLNDLKRNNINVDAVFTSEFLGVYKPKKDFYLEILNKTGYKEDEVLFVGDSLLDDVYGPQLVNIKTCWINRKNTSPDDKRCPDYIISNLEELLYVPILKEIIDSKKEKG